MTETLGYRPATDDEYYEWRRNHLEGWIVNVSPMSGASGPMLHRAICGHISTHNNEGAFTEGEAKKLCFDSYASLKQWRLSAEAAGLRLCKDCKAR